MPAKGKIVMSKDSFFKEHKKLIGLLKSASRFVKEGQSQQREMMKYKK